MNNGTVCDTCGQGKLENSIVSLPNECCAIYFYGKHSPGHRDWVSFVKATPLTAKLSATEQMMADSAKEIAYWKGRALKAEAELDALEACEPEDSPPFKPATVNELEARGFQRVNRNWFSPGVNAAIKEEDDEG